MFRDDIRIKNPGVKHKKNPIYEMKDIKLIKLKDIPQGIRPDRYYQLVEPDFIGILAISYEKDNIGNSGGNAQWCYVYECNQGKLTYKGTAIHKCADLDNTEQNYNEKLYSIFAKLALNQQNIRIANIDLVKNLEWPEDKPAILSYNVVQREEASGRDLEEMIVMKTIAFNNMERQDIHGNRLPLDTILEAVRIQVMKKVGYKKQESKEKIDDAIISAKIAKQLGNEHTELSEEQEKLLLIIKEKMDNINGETTLESFAREVSLEMGREVTEEEINAINAKGVSVVQILKEIKAVAREKEENYLELEKSIIQTTVVDLLTNNTDRHLTNWALIRNKKNDRYILGLFDHAASFINMSTKTRYIGITDEYLKEYWVPSSVLLNTPLDIKNESSRGISVFRYLMNKYREYVLEILQKIYDKLPEYEKIIQYETTAYEDYMKLPESERKKYYQNEAEMTICPKKIMDGFKEKYRKIEKDFNISFNRGKDDYRNN